MQATHDAERSLRQIISAFINTESESLVKTLCSYVIYAGLASGPAVLPLAQELLSDVFIEALKQPESFEQAQSQKAWLLGIAANLVKRKQVELAKRNRREPLMRDLVPHFENNLDDGELSDWLNKARIEESDAYRKENEVAEELLSRVSPEDAHILRLALLYELDGEALAKELGVKPGTARMRLHRAIRRLQLRVKEADHE